MYQEGDFLNALAIYSRLAELNETPGWRLPVWYQIGLVYEHLAQPQKASEFYGRILTSPADPATIQPNPCVQVVLDMAKWRKDYLAWQTRSEQVSSELHLSPSSR